MNYHENKSFTNEYKIEYRESILKLAQNLELNAEKEREIYIRDIMRDKERYRRELADMLGFPLNVERPSELPKVWLQKLSDEGEFSIYRMQIEVLENHKITGLFFKYNDDEVRPFAVVQHGVLGTPELISGIYGSTANYNDMLLRVLERGINVFAPQMLLWGKDEYGVENFRVELDSRLKRAGSSIVAIESYSVMRIIDYFASQPYTSAVGMVGLSYGGFFTQVMSALDTRIKAAISCSFFCGNNDWYEQPDVYREKDMLRFGHAEMACLVHPRKLFVEMGNRDELFDYEKSALEVERVKNLCGNDCGEWLDFKVYDGNHEFYKENVHLDAFAECLKS